MPSIPQKLEYNRDLYECTKCQKHFASWKGLLEHLGQSPHHGYCRICSNDFGTREQLVEHIRSVHHCCTICYTGKPSPSPFGTRIPRAFASPFGLHRHYCQAHSLQYCVPCKRAFTSADNLASHLRSATHQGRQVNCPSSACEKRFVSVAALLIHLESGTCVSGISLEDVVRAAVHVDHEHVVTVADANKNACKGRYGIYGSLQEVESKTKWNGRRYGCPLCGKSTTSLLSMRAHMRSPVHIEKIFCCSAHGGCDLTFRTLSALCQHVESQKCIDMACRSKAKGVIEDIVKQVV
ncbi:hypothetical protein GY45DRAFT_1329537 [Cubamyces sp. BRFM 1775]|nr:hypothetical protein GY45DRAFT_1329537 [Cubamyces sp. BRFM 1775]